MKSGICDHIKFVFLLWRVKGILLTGYSQKIWKRKLNFLSKDWKEKKKTNLFSGWEWDEITTE